MIIYQVINTALIQKVCDKNFNYIFTFRFGLQHALTILCIAWTRRTNPITDNADIKIILSWERVSVTVSVERNEH